MSSPAKKKEKTVKSYSLIRKNGAWACVETTVSIDKGTVIEVKQVAEPDMLPITVAKLVKFAKAAVDE